MSDGLPEGWVLAKLGEICSKPQYGWTTPARENGNGLKLLRTTDISSGGIDWSTVPACAEEPDDPKRYLLHPGDIVIARAGSVGISYVLQDCPRSVFASYLIRFRPLGEIRSDFIGLFLRSPAYWAGITEGAAGIAVPNINASKLAALELPLPPLAEQRRVVDRAAALLGQVDRARGRLAKVPLILKRFRLAVLAEASSGRLTNQMEPEDGELPPGWQLVPLGELLPKGGLFDGPFGSSLKTSDYTRSGVRVIRLENVGHLRFNNEKRTFVSDEKYRMLRKHTVGEGDIIFGSFVGDAVRVCVLPPLDSVAIAKADCFCLRPRADLVDRNYLAMQLAGNRTRLSLLEEIHGATRPRINTAQLRAVVVPICPRPEQLKIVRILQGLWAVADKIEQRLKSASANAARLSRGILSRAFEGNLVPREADLARIEGRSFESASTLLDRIQREREVSDSHRCHRTPKTGRIRAQGPAVARDRVVYESGR